MFYSRWNEQENLKHSLFFYPDNMFLIIFLAGWSGQIIDRQWMDVYQPGFSQSLSLYTTFDELGWSRGFLSNVIRTSCYRFSVNWIQNPLNIFHILWILNVQAVGKLHLRINRSFVRWFNWIFARVFEDQECFWSSLDWTSPIKATNSIYMDVRKYFKAYIYRVCTYIHKVWFICL